VGYARAHAVRIADCELRIANCGLRIADCELATTELPPKEAYPVEQSLRAQIDEWAMLVRMSITPNVRDLLDG
jgi:hypothetical protein